MKINKRHYKFNQNNNYIFESHPQFISPNTTQRMLSVSKIYSK
jgi:hypothetical protein